MLSRHLSHLGHLFARVIARYQREKGRKELVESFLKEILGIPEETIAEAYSYRMMHGEAEEENIEPSSPEMRLPESGQSPFRSSLRPPQRPELPIEDTIIAAVPQAATREIERLAKRMQNVTNAVHPNSKERQSEQVGGGPTIEQVEQGEEGEEEVRRRLLSGEWEGWQLTRDRRKDGCGYDLDVETPDGPRALEIKTVAPDGSIHFGWRQYLEARRRQQAHRLMILVAQGDNPRSWKSWYWDDPAQRMQAEDVRVTAEPELVVPIREWLGR